MSASGRSGTRPPTVMPGEAARVRMPRRKYGKLTKPIGNAAGKNSPRANRPAK